MQIPHDTSWKLRGESPDHRPVPLRIAPTPLEAAWVPLDPLRMRRSKCLAHKVVAHLCRVQKGENEVARTLGQNKMEQNGSTSANIQFPSYAEQTPSPFPDYHAPLCSMRTRCHSPEDCGVHCPSSTGHPSTQLALGVRPRELEMVEQRHLQRGCALFGHGCGI